MKPGPKPKLGETMTIINFRVLPDQKEMIRLAGDADFWRSAMESIAAYKLAFDDGFLSKEDFSQWSGDAILASAILSHADNRQVQ